MQNIPGWVELANPKKHDKEMYSEFCAMRRDANLEYKTYEKLNLSAHDYWQVAPYHFKGSQLQWVEW